MRNEKNNGLRAAAAHGGFTLIELLVVIAILALLASILMPALQKAYLVAMSVKCKSHARSVLGGYLVYAQDNDDFIVSTCITDASGFPTAEVTRALLLKYMATPLPSQNRDQEIFCCPTATKLRDTGGAAFAAAGMPLWNSMGPSIVFGAGPAGPDVVAVDGRIYYWGTPPVNPGRITPRRFGDCKWPATTGGIADSYYYGLNSWNPAAAVPPVYRHPGKQINVAAADGHVGQMSLDQGLSAKPPFEITRYR